MRHCGAPWVDTETHTLKLTNIGGRNAGTNTRRGHLSMRDWRTCAAVQPYLPTIDFLKRG
jgi:hypothetical protein